MSNTRQRQSTTSLNSEKQSHESEHLGNFPLRTFSVTQEFAGGFELKRREPRVEFSISTYLKTRPGPQPSSEVKDVLDFPEIKSFETLIAKDFIVDASRFLKEINNNKRNNKSLLGISCAFADSKYAQGI
ncbi:hypothetical protein AVEN_63183-1 [Araneus ventricosus]|uniref:Uncharacterized protein n=1 Tax=Araneus ventricosus TaxID=182803 RepID=A0A4Y2B470_ARAVE|nr:hypothetical protein AVEN_63183-1 [Araneus ventricosus]